MTNAICGVCGTSLPETAALQNVEQAAMEEKRKDDALQRRPAREELRREALQTLAGVVVGIAIIIGGFLNDGWIVLTLPVGLFVVAVASTGGFGEGGLYAAMRFRNWVNARLTWEEEERRERTASED